MKFWREKFREDRGCNGKGRREREGGEVREVRVVGSYGSLRYCLSFGYVCVRDWGEGRMDAVNFRKGKFGV